MMLKLNEVIGENMYEYITGTVVSIHPTYIVLEQQGIGYLITVPNPYRLHEKVNQTVRLYIEQVVREDSILLYGFLTSDEKSLFLQLISVSGIGPRSAVSILATEDHEGFVQAIDSESVTQLTKYPGVGKKTAQRIILELKGKFVSTATAQHSTQQELPEESPVIAETISALEGLGYSMKEIKKILPALKESGLSSTQEALRMAFKLLI